MTSPSVTAAAASFRGLVRSRRSTRRFQPNRKIPHGVLRDVLESTLTAPSGFNMQPTQVVLVRNQEMKQRLAKEAMLGGGNQWRTQDASVLAVFLSDLHVHKRLSRILELEKEGKMRDPAYMALLPVVSTFLTGEGHAATWMKQVATTALSAVQPMPSIESVEAWSYKNTALAAQTYTLAAHSHGLATCMMEGYDNRRVQRLLEIPAERYSIPLIVATGYEYQNESLHSKKTPRLPLEEVFFDGTFGVPLSDLDDDTDLIDEETDISEVAASS